MCTLAPGEVIHSDLSGCFPSSAHSGAEYYITFINEATCYASMYLLSCKSEAIEAFKSYLTTSPHAACCRSLVTDQGGEYLSTRFRKLLHKHGIAHDTVAVHSPELNSIAKHFNLTIMTMVQSLLTDSCLLCSMWDEALQTTTHINNWLPTRSKSGHTLHELWMGEPPMYKHLHLFRCHAHILQPSATHSKLNDQSMPTVYLRPAHDNAQHHRLWIPNMDSIIESRDVVFSKTAKVDRHTDDTVSCDSATGSEASDSESDRAISDTNSSRSINATSSGDELSAVSDTELDELVSDTADGELDRFVEDINTDSKLNKSAGDDPDESTSSIAITNGEAKGSTSSIESFATASNTEPDANHVHNDGASHSLPRFWGEWADYQPEEDNSTMPSLMDGLDDKDNSNDNNNDDESNNNNGGATSSGGNTIIGLNDQVLNLGTRGDYNVTSDVDWMPADEEQAALR